MVSEQDIQGVFADAPFIAHLGIELEGIGTGWCEASLSVQPWQLQQTGVVHAGAVATLRTVESEVFAERSGKRSLVAKLNATMAVVRSAKSS